MLMDPYRGVGHMPFVRCIELGCVAYVSIGWVGDEVVVGVGVGIEWWWFYVVGLIGGKLMVVGSVVGMVVGGIVGIVVEVVVGGSVVFAVVVTLEVAPTGCEGRLNSEVGKHAYLEL